MKRVNLNLYESQYPLPDINGLWVDKDEITGDIKAIHKYNKDIGKWEPYLVSINYLNK